MDKINGYILIFCVVIASTITTQIQAQELPSESNPTSPKKEYSDTLHSPKKAALLSIVPGGGQIYNHLAMPKGKKKAAWKVPIIYAGLGATGYFAVSYGIQANNLKKEYRFREANGFPNLPKYEAYDNQGILSLFESSRTSRDLFIFGFALVYGLNIIDAYVEAHFVHFDVSKDLTLSIIPTMQDFRTPGVGLIFGFK